MIRALALLLCLLPAALRAEPFPALFDVNGVAASDVLNVREGPTVAAPIIAALAPTRTDVEVVALSDGEDWGLVNTGEGAGWVSMRYMSRQPGQDWGFVPQSFACSGTEPFWSLRVFDNDAAEVTALDDARGYAVSRRVTALAHVDDFAVVAAAPDGRMTALVSRSDCSDGMSDRAFGYSVGLLLEGPGTETLYNGCCSLVP